MINNFIRKFISKKLFIKSSDIILKETIENDDEYKIAFICKYGNSLTEQELSINNIELETFINNYKNEIRKKEKAIRASPAMVESAI